MTYLCELCGKPGVYRFIKGFQMVACRSCAESLADGTNWQPVTVPTSRPNIPDMVAEWRQQRYMQEEAEYD